MLADEPHSRRALILGWAIVLACLGLAPADAQSSPVGGKCGVFSELTSAPGMPAGFALMAGVGVEVLAANDCMQRNNVAMACEHYRRALRAVDKMEPAPAAERRPKIKAQMDALACT